jgi:hypothetical protein
MEKLRTEVAAIAAGVSIVVLLSGCSGTRSRTPPTGTQSTQTAPLPAPLPQGTPSANVVRDCGSSGQHGVTADSLQQALTVGPISLGGLGAELTHSGLPHTPGVRGRYLSLEAIAVVRAGATVVLVVPRAERRYVALIYSKSNFRSDGLYRIRDLASVVRFEACRDAAFNHGISQFDGGLVVAGRRCFSLDFFIAGRKRVIRRRLPLGRRCSAAPLR